MGRLLETRPGFDDDLLPLPLDPQGVRLGIRRAKERIDVLEGGGHGRDRGVVLGDGWLDLDLERLAGEERRGLLLVGGRVDDLSGRPRERSPHHRQGGTVMGGPDLDAPGAVRVQRQVVFDLDAAG